MRIRPFPLLPRDVSRDIGVEQQQASLLMPVMRNLVAKGRAVEKADWIALAAALRNVRNTGQADTKGWSITKPEESNGANTILHLAFNAYLLELMAQNDTVFVGCAITTPEHTLMLFGSSTEKLFYLLDVTKSRLFVVGNGPDGFTPVFERIYGKMVVFYQCYAMELQ